MNGKVPAKGDGEKKRHKKDAHRDYKEIKEMREVKIETALFGSSYNQMRLFHSSISSHRISDGEWRENVLTGPSNHAETLISTVMLINT